MFDQVFCIQKGLVLGAKMVPRNDTVAAMAIMILDKIRKVINISKLHKIMMHPSKDLKATDFVTKGHICCDKTDENYSL
jgi:hypothetical protein